MPPPSSVTSAADAHLAMVVPLHVAMLAMVPIEAAPAGPSSIGTAIPGSAIVVAGTGASVVAIALHLCACAGARGQRRHGKGNRSEHSVGPHHGISRAGESGARTV